MKTSADKHGFTLIEVQIAVALFVLMLMLGYGALHFAGRSWQTLERTTTDIETQRLIAEFLRRQMEQAVPIMLKKNNQRQLIFSGRRNGMRFVGRLPDHRGYGLHVIQLSHRRNDLKLKYRPLIDESSIAESFNTGEGHVLLTDIDQVTFGYYGSEHENDPPRWHEQWQASSQPPLLIRLNIEPADDIDWPVITAAYHARAQSGRPELIIHGVPDVGL